METVGVRELKLNLSRYLRKVKSGERIMVTDRNKEVAVITPVREVSLEDKLLQMVGQGLAYWTGEKPAGIKRRVASRGGSVSAAVIEDRR
jgi:prevent-host-death family protein